MLPVAPDFISSMRKGVPVLSNHIIQWSASPHLLDLCPSLLVFLVGFIITSVFHIPPPAWKVVPSITSQRICQTSFTNVFCKIIFPGDGVSKLDLIFFGEIKSDSKFSFKIISSSIVEIISIGSSISNSSSSEKLGNIKNKKANSIKHTIPFFIFISPVEPHT